jgi:hypothetical protein
MTNADDIFDQASGNISRLGLREIPFTESPIDLKSETLRRRSLTSFKAGNAAGFWCMVGSALGKVPFC